MSNAQFKKLFEPGSIGTMLVKNRIVLAPMATNYASEEGYVTEKSKAYYEERAKGGTGLLIIEATSIDHRLGHAVKRQISIDSDKYIPGLAGLARAIQQHGAKAAIQLAHAGRLAKCLPAGVQAIGPSAIPAPGFGVPKELIRSEIKDLVDRFAQGAERAVKAGFDGIEIHGAHGYIIDQFLSQSSNKRQDEYGGDVRRRAKLLIEVIEACRQAVGKDFPLWVRINAREYNVEKSVTIEEAKEIARLAEAAGADAIHVSAFPISSQRFHPLAEPPGNLVFLAHAVKKAVKVPVIAVGRITPEIGERILRQGKADFVAMGRQLIADPYLPNKIASGKTEDIAPCIQCLYCQETLRDFGRGEADVRCAVNAITGHEGEYQIEKAEKIKRVVVVGGGPAGMEAARVARLRGHEVTLYDQARSLGGLLQVAAVPPYKYGIRLLMDYLESQIVHLGVKIKLGREVTPDLVIRAKPDVVICATGSEPYLPDIPGIDQDNVVLAGEVLTGHAEVGDKVVVIGGGLVGCETADYLAGLGKSVTVVEVLDRIGASVGDNWRKALQNKLSLHDSITVLTSTKCEKVTGGGLTITDKTGARSTLQADTIVVAAGAKPRTALFDALQGKGIAVHRAGDCVMPRRILEATEEGSRIGRIV